jgi:hypothetical protein
MIKAGRLADLAVLSDDYFSIPESEIVHLRSVLTMLGGTAVHGEGDFAPLAPELPAPLPDWSPVAAFGGYHRAENDERQPEAACGCASACAVHGHHHARAARQVPAADPASFWGAFGCGCWAV